VQYKHNYDDCSCDNFPKLCCNFPNYWKQKSYTGGVGNYSETPGIYYVCTVYTVQQVKSISYDLLVLPFLVCRADGPSLVVQCTLHTYIRTNIKYNMHYIIYSNIILTRTYPSIYIYIYIFIFVCDFVLVRRRVYSASLRSRCQRRVGGRREW